MGRSSRFASGPSRRSTTSPSDKRGLFFGEVVPICIGTIPTINNEPHRQEGFVFLGRSSRFVSGPSRRSTTSPSDKRGLFFWVGRPDLYRDHPAFKMFTPGKLFYRSPLTNNGQPGRKCHCLCLTFSWYLLYWFMAVIQMF